MKLNATFNVIRALMILILALSLAAPAQTDTAAAASSWASAEINTSTAGSTTESGFALSVRGSGSGITGAKDSFRFAYDTLSGDLTLQARITAWSNGGSNTARGGLMLRSSTQPGSAFVMVGMAGAKGIRFTWRSADGKRVSEVSGPATVALPVWLQLKKVGSSYQASYSVDSLNWTNLPASPVTASLASPYLAGFGVTAGKSNLFASLIADTITGPAPLINAISPLSGGVGSQVIVTGEYLTGASLVRLGGISANYQVISPYELRLTVPSGPDGPVSVTTPGGTAASTAAFDIQWPPTLSSFMPLSGMPLSWVDLNGINLSDVTEVQFNGIAATEFTPVSNTLIRARVPLEAATGPVTLKSPYGTVTSLNAFIVPNLTGLDIGNTGLPGRTLFDGKVYVEAAGTGYRGTFDSFHYTFDSMNATQNGLEFSASIAGRAKGQNAQTGLMLRTSTRPDAPFASVYLDGNGQLMLTWRSALGEAVMSQAASVQPPAGTYWLSLLATPGGVTAAISSDGKVWLALSPAMPLTWQDPLLYGLASSSGDSSVYGYHVYDAIHANPPQIVIH